MPRLSQGETVDVRVASVKLTTIYRRSPTFTRITTLRRVRQVPGTTDHGARPGKTLIVPTTKKPFYSGNRNIYKLPTTSCIFFYYENKVVVFFFWMESYCNSILKWIISSVYHDISSWCLWYKHVIKKFVFNY